MDASIVGFVWELTVLEGVRGGSVSRSTGSFPDDPDSALGFSQGRIKC